MDSKQLRSESEADSSEIQALLTEIQPDIKDHPDGLIPVLQKVQKKLGYLPEKVLLEIARIAKLPPAQVFGVATFYSFFKLVPTGRNVVRVCRGTACHVRGGARILKEVEKQLAVHPGESTPDLEYCLETVACIGACALAPTMRINDETYGQMTKKKVAQIIKHDVGAEK